MERSVTHPNELRCPRCGKAVKRTATGGLCSSCLFLALSEASLVPSIDRYRVLETLGEGGFGVVYIAEQTEPVRRQVALKVIRLGMDTRSVVARFEAERQALAVMDHPNIAKVFDAGLTHEGRPYFAMELVRGIPITDYCDQHVLPTRERLELFVKVCQAIQHAHQKGLIHRDIKPSNILATVSDGVPVPKVIDFGIAKATEGRLTQATGHTQVHQFIGTPSYVSPEQAERGGLDIDTRSDVYSLGVLLYELLTGQTPFDARQLASQGIDAMRRTIREQEPLRPSTRLATMAIPERTRTAQRRSSDGARLIGQLRGDLDWIVMKCLEKDRARRYETANGLAADLGRYLRDEMVVARPPSAAYRLLKFVRRNRTLVGSLAGVGLALLAGSGVSVWQAMRATTAGRAAAAAREVAEQHATLATENARRAAEERMAAEAARRLAVTNEWAMRQRAYASDMVFAQQAVAIRNLARARELLGHWSNPSPTPPAAPGSGGIGSETVSDLRGWEWRYLWDRSQPQPVEVLGGTWDAVRSLAVSPDARWAAIADAAGQLTFWNLAEDRLVWSLRSEDRNSQVAFHPNGEVLAYVAKGSEQPGGPSIHQLWLINPSTRAVRAHCVLPGECRGMGFSGDGEQVVVLVYQGANERLFQVRDTSTGQLLATHPASYGWSMGLAFDLATKVPLAAHGTSQGEARVVNWKTGEERLRVPVNGLWVSSLALSPDGRLLAASGSYNDTSVHLYEVDTGREIRVLDGHRDWIPCLRFASEGRVLISCSADATIRVWDLERPGNSQVHVASKDEVSRIAVGSLLLSGTVEGKVQVWRDVQQGVPDTDSVVLPGTFWLAGFHEQSGALVTLGRDGVVARWQNPGFQERLILGQAPPPTFWGSALSSNGRWLAVASQGSVRVFGTDTAGPAQELAVQPDVSSVLGFADRDEKVLVGNVGERSLRVYDRATGRELRRVDLPGALAMSTDLTSDGREILVFEPTSLFDWAQGRRREFMAEAAYGAAFSPSGRYLAFTGSRGEVGLWQVEALRRMKGFRSSTRAFHSVAFSPDDRRLVGGEHGAESIVLWDRETALQLLALPAVGVVIESVRFSPDGNSILALSRDARVQIWTAPSWEQIAAASSGANSESEVVSPK